MQDWADEGIIRVVFVTSPGKFISTIEGEQCMFCSEHLNECHCSISFMLWLFTQHLRTDALMNATGIRRTSRAVFVTMEGMDESEAMIYLYAHNALFRATVLRQLENATALNGSLALRFRTVTDARVRML